jgi:predicted O-methyltransferase YrrM
MASLQSFEVPAGGPATIFLLPEGGMKELYDAVIVHNFRNCLELGSGFGATSCVLAAAAQEIGGKLTTIDMYRPIISAELLRAHVGLGDEMNCVVDPLGYNWWLADRIRERTRRDGTCEPLFDLIFLDGAHEWQPDALATYLAVRLLKPGGWFVLDDLDFKLRMIPNWKESHGRHSDRELDEFQIRMVWDLVVTKHPELRGFRITQKRRMGWACKLSVPEKTERHRPLRAIRRLLQGSLSN